MKTFAPITLALLAAFAGLSAGSALAKLPAPSDEAKAKSAEAAAKAAHGDKVANFKLCKSQDNVAASYQAAAKKAGTPAPAPVTTPPCADPGPFVYVPAGAAAAAPAAPAAAATAAAPAAPAPAVAKK